MYGVPLLAVQSTDAMKDQDIDVARGGVLCTLSGGVHAPVFCAGKCGFNSDVGVAKGIS